MPTFSNTGKLPCMGSRPTWRRMTGSGKRISASDKYNTGGAIMRRTLLAATAFFAFSTASHAAENVKIGVVYPLTGPYAVAGADCNSGLALASEQINAAGGIKSMQDRKSVA